ncbi:unnamed protein product [Periconia digitata]|uniref:Uncharacterized protein n=1 Tax=Periconia digitata TaxID=1303443 RepID=A0A9W4UQ43_9PLEO|nr:unnamed protein product [Periconia digitata]
MRTMTTVHVTADCEALKCWIITKCGILRSPGSYCPSHSTTKMFWTGPVNDVENLSSRSSSLYLYNRLNLHFDLQYQLESENLY